MDTQYSFQANLFSLNYWRIMQAFFCCWLLCTSCHKEDTGAYALSSEAFYAMAVSEQKYQQLLNEELSKITSHVRFPEIAKQRIEKSKKYMSELNSVVGVFAEDSSTAIGDENMERLIRLRKLAGDNFKKELVRMTIESDQQLISIHVRAVSPTGAKDPRLRDWAEQMMPTLTENLAEIQLLR